MTNLCSCSNLVIHNVRNTLMEIMIIHRILLIMVGGTWVTIIHHCRSSFRYHTWVCCNRWLHNKERKKDCPGSERLHRGKRGRRSRRKEEKVMERGNRLIDSWLMGCHGFRVLALKIFSQGSTPLSPLQILLISCNLKEFCFRQIFLGQQWLWCVLPLMTSQDRGRLFSL